MRNGIQRGCDGISEAFSSPAKHLWCQQCQYYSEGFFQHCLITDTFVFLFERGKGTNECVSVVKKKKKKSTQKYLHLSSQKKCKLSRQDEHTVCLKPSVLIFLQSAYKVRLLMGTCSPKKPKSIFDFMLVVGGGGGRIMHSSESGLPSDSSVVKNMKKKRDDNLYVTQFRGNLTVRHPGDMNLESFKHATIKAGCYYLKMFSLSILLAVGTLFFFLITANDVVQCVQSITNDFRVRPDESTRRLTYYWNIY